MQVAPIKPTLKAPKTKRLKPKCDAPLSSDAFKFNLGRYVKAAGTQGKATQYGGTAHYMSFYHAMVWLCRLIVSKPELKARLQVVSALESKL